MLAGNSVDSLTQLLERIVHADKVGLDVFGIGEHHRKEFLDSAPTMILAAAAAIVTLKSILIIFLNYQHCEPAQIHLYMALQPSCLPHQVDKLHNRQVDLTR